MIWVVVPSRTDEYVDNLLRSLEVSEPGSSEFCVVADNGLSPKIATRWPCTMVQVPTPFCFATAINRAVTCIPHSSDILILNDDTTMVTDFWRMRAERLLQLKEYASYGLISFAIDGGVGNPEQRRVSVDDETPVVVEATKTICFVAVLVRRKAWDAVGQMDERFVFYGHDDDDAVHRMKLGGWKCGVTQKVVVTHGADGRAHSSSYLRYHGSEEAERMFHRNQAIYIAKWQGPPGYEKLTEPTP